MLIRGRELERLLAKLRPKIDEDIRRIVAKGRELNIRIDRYVDTQAPAAVRESLSRLVTGRKWRFVKFSEFVEALGGIVDRLWHAVGPDADVCFAVDSMRKSSFWVVAMALLTRPPASFERVSVAVEVDERMRDMGVESDGGDGGGLFSAFKQLPAASTRIVLMDDATYSGDQLSYFCDFVCDSWAHSHPRGPKPSVFVAVPYMSTSSIVLFSKRRLGKGRLLSPAPADLFDTMFYRRSLANVLSSDVFFEGASDYNSLFFDVLGLRPTNSLFVFEHKVADSLSIPNLWLKVGPCLPSDAKTHAYRCRPEQAAALAKAVRADVGRRMWGDGLPGTAAQRLLYGAVQRVLGLMHSAKFRAEFMERVSLAADAGRPPTPRTMPLMPMEFCDQAYRDYMRHHGRRMVRIRPTSDGDDEIPPCRRPPYQRGSFRRPFLFSERARP